MAFGGFWSNGDTWTDSMGRTFAVITEGDIVLQDGTEFVIQLDNI